MTRKLHRIRSKYSFQCRVRVDALSVEEPVT